MLGIVIPYYVNSMECENNFKLLMKTLEKQLTKSMILYIYEDGQKSLWLDKYVRRNIIVVCGGYNKGVSYARNMGIEYLKDKVDYILFIDSDDMVDGLYLRNMARACYTNNYDVVESYFFVNDKLKEYGDNIIRTSVTGTAFRVSVIDDLRFDDYIQIGEDKDFIEKLWKKKLIKKCLVKNSYFYNYGSNMNSLMMRYIRKEIREYR